LLPCKVPLGRQFDAVLAGPLEASRFTPAEARRAVQSLSSVSAPPGSPFRPYAVAIIDLTKTERYYTPEQEGLSTARTPLHGPGVVKHVKIPCAGSDGPPTPSEVNQFIYWVDVLLDEALRSRREAGEWPVILVHCTHGFNRTGAMLVHYAMRCKGARPDLVNAVARFADARTPGIYKEGYLSGALTCSHACSLPRYMSGLSHTALLAALFEYYHDVRPMPPHAACPPLPAWKREKQLGNSVAAPPVPDAEVPPGDLWGASIECTDDSPHCANSHVCCAPRVRQ
jgi:mRNA-capping enzyme